MNNTPPNGPGNQPWGQPGQDPQQWGQQPGGQQWGQQPNDPQWGQQPSGQQWGQQPPGQWGQPVPGGPGGEPPKKKTGLIIGAIVAALILVGGGIAAAIALSGDDDKDDKKADDKTSQSVEPTDSTTDSTEEPTDTPTTEDTPPVPDGDAVTGDGYSFALPDGWIDASTDPGATSTPSIDTVAAWGNELNGSRANMIVETQAAGTATGPDDLKETWIATMTQATGGATPEDAASITVDGNETIGVRFERDNGAGVQIVQIAHLLVHGDTAYAITLSFRPDDESEVMDYFDEMISSWSFA